MKKLSIAVAALTLIAIGAPASQATTMIQGGPYTNLNPAGDKVHFGFAAFPTGKGFYFYEAVKPAAGARPTVYNPAQVWVSESQGATSPKGDIAVSVSGTFGTADCSKDACGIFVRLDHTDPTNTSEDQFFPISFKAGSSTPAIAPDTISVTIDGKAVSGQAPGTLNYRTPKTLVVTTGSGVAATIASSTPDCSVTGNVIEALKSTGACDFAVTSTGNAMAAAKTSHFPFMLAPGTQSLASALPATLKLGKSVTLATMTNFGEKISYTVTGSKNCSLKGVKLTAVQNGACLVKYSAPAGMNYPELMGSSVVKVSK
jgi:hypothetical protein